MRSDRWRRIQVVNDVNCDISFAVMSVLRKRKIKFFTVFANLVTFIARLGFRGGCDRYAWEIMK